MSVDENSRLRDILSAAAKCQEYANHLGGEQDSMAYDAIVRNLAIIGEAVSKLSDQLRQSQPHIPWSKIIGLRNILIHQYFSADRQLVELILARDLAELVAAVTSMLKA